MVLIHYVLEIVNAFFGHLELVKLGLGRWGLVLVDYFDFGVEVGKRVRVVTVDLAHGLIKLFLFDFFGIIFLLIFHFFRLLLLKL